MIIDLNYRVDILKGIASQNAEHPLYYDDQNAHRVNVSLYRGQEEINLSGLSCNGYVVFVKEGASIGPLTGEVSNNTCSVVLPHEAYQHPGAIRVEIKLIEGDSVTTVLMLTGHVSSGRGDRVIDITGSIVPSLDSLKATIEELERRVAAIEVSEVVELGTKVSIISRGHGENLISLEDFTDILSGVTCVVDSENQTLTATCAKGTYCSVQTSSTWVQEHLIPGHTYRLHAKTERISGSPEIRVAFRGTQSSYATIPIGGGIYYDNNVGGDGFIDLTIDQYVKRVSLFITMGTSAAASVTFSDIWIVDVTDETVRYDATKTAILDAGCYVDWGWVPGEQTATVAGVAVTRNGNRITLNGTTSNYGYIRMCGSLVGVVGGEATAAQNISGFTTIPGHLYLFKLRLLSGSISYSGTVSYSIGPSHRWASTTTSPDSSTLPEIDSEGWIFRWFTGNGNGITTWLYFVSGVEFTNAEFELTAIDATADSQTNRTAGDVDARLSGGYPISWYGVPAFKRYGNLAVSYFDGIARLSGTYWTNNASTMWSVSNGIQTYGGQTNNSFVNPTAILKAGHTYRVSAIILSGTVTGTSTSKPAMRYYTRVGTGSVATTEFTTDLISATASATYPIVFDKYATPASDTQIGFGFWTRSPSQGTAETYNDLTVVFRVEDISLTGTAAQNIAAADTLTATSSHAFGSLLTVGGRLYKATQAIAPGDTIAAGTNVTATDVAAQLAKRDSAIAAVSSAARAGVLAALDAQAAIDFGWVAGDQTETVNGVTAVRNGNRITLNGTTTGNNQARFRMIGSLIAKSGEPTATENIAGPTMVSGHTYAVTMRLVSGTITKNAADSGTVSTVLNKSGTSSTTFESHLYSTLNENGYLYRWFVGDGNALTLWLFFGAKLTATNAVFEYALIDTTAADKTQYPAALALGASTTVGGDVPVEYYGAPGSITTSNKMGVSKLWGNRVTLNGVGSSGTYGMVTIHNGVRFLNNWNTNDNFVQIPLLEGHTYLLSARVISGTTVQVGNADSGIVYFTKVGTEEVGVPNFTLTMNADFANGIRVWTRRYTAAANTLIGFGFYFRQMTATNLVIEFNAKDITACVDGAGNIAQQDTKTAGNQHAAGDLLTVGGTLYKATQAIAPGETINPGTNVTATTVAAQLAERDTAIAAVEADAEDIFMEPWQLVAKKYFLPDSAGNLTVRRNHITYRPSASQSSPAVRSLIGAYEGANTTLGNYTPTIDQLIPVSVFGDAIKIGFYLDAAGTDRYPRFAYKFCTVDGETVTPISGAQGSLPATSATGVLAETSVTIPDGATHVFFGLLYSNGYKENATYDMVYKVDKG